MGPDKRADNQIFLADPSLCTHDSGSMSLENYNVDMSQFDLGDFGDFGDMLNTTQDINQINMVCFT
jgi:hypothetical protein